MSTAFAADPITVSLAAVDYRDPSVPVTKSYVDNERFAVAVAIDLPPFCDTTNLALKLEYQGVELDEGFTLCLAEGRYILTGTVTNAVNAAIRVTVQDTALEAAETAEDLYNAMQADRTVSATFSFKAKSAAVSYEQDAMAIPKTGDAPAIGLAALPLMGMAGILLTGKRRKF